jgi:hypothetical protein
MANKLVRLQNTVGKLALDTTILQINIYSVENVQDHCIEEFYANIITTFSNPSTL